MMSEEEVKDKTTLTLPDEDIPAAPAPPEAKKPKLVLTRPKPQTPLKQKTHFIGIHLGAGTHSPKLHDVYKSICKSACEAGLRVLKRGGSADEAATAATVILENCGFVNAGKGSNLTLDKTVELDAGFMNGSGHFGGVGAVEGVPNPILIAHKIAQLQDPDNKMSCGRVPPTFLVGPGARKWAISQQIPNCEPEELVSAKALKRYAKYMKRIADVAKTDKPSLINGLVWQGTGKAKKVVYEGGVSDTVGVIALDHSNNVAATVSSGGNWLKFPGRVGHSPQFGAGCWAMNRGPLSESCVAVSTSGVGEMLSKVQWAATCGNALQSDNFDTPVAAISSVIKENFLDSDLLQDRKEAKIVGMLGLSWDGHHGEVVWGHSSSSLVVGLAGSGFKRVKTVFSNLSPKSAADGAFKVEGMSI